MKYLTYKLISPDGYQVEYLTSGQKKNPTLKDLLEGHEMRIQKIESYGWKVQTTTPTPTGPLESTTQSQGVIPDMAAQVKHCQSCGAAMDYREGVSKAGKAYKGFFCPTDKSHEVIWVK